jgi:hypothetical protein
LPVLLIASVLATCGFAEAQTTAGRTRQAGANLPASASVRPASVTRCFVANCSRCNSFNPYFCAECGLGYALTSGFSCTSCAPGFEQNLDVQTFTCSACPAGTTSPGGTGQESQCEPIPTVTTGRRLFGAEDDLWA